MIKTGPNIIHLGRLSLIDEVSQKTLKVFGQLSLAFRADSSEDFITKSWQYKFDGNGDVNFYTSVPEFDLAREFEQQDYILQFSLSVPGFQDLVHSLTVTSDDWSQVLSNARQSMAGKLLFDEAISMSPVAVTAQVSVYRTDGMTVTPTDVYLKITLPELAAMDGVSISDVLAIWSFNPLPLVSAITVTVFSADDDSELGSKALTIDYSQAVNRWEIPVTV